MSVIAWDDSMSVGVEVLDNDHKKLIDLINRLAEAGNSTGSEQTVGEVLDELVAYTRYHFRREEAWQAAAGYPDLERHKEIHEDLTEQVEEVRDDYRKGYSESLTRDVLVFLRDWLKKHILGEDKKYVAYVAEVSEADVPAV